MVKAIKRILSVNKLLAIATIFGVLVILFYKLPFLHAPYGYDQSAYLFEGKQLSLGAIPYRDVWDLRLLGLGYLYAFLFKIGITSLATIRVVELSWLLATILSLAVLLGMIFSRHKLAASIGVVYFAFLSGNFPFSSYDGGGYVEPYLALPSILLLIFLILFGRTRRSIWLVSAGLAVFVAVMFRPTSLALALPAIAYLYYIYKPTQRSEKWDIKRLTRSILIPAITFAFPMLAYLIYLNHYGALSEMASAMVKFNSYYSHTIPEMNRNDAGLYSMVLYSANCLMKYLAEYPLSYFVAIFGSIGLIKHYKPFHMIVILFFLVSVAEVASGMKPWPHYFIQLFPALAILASYSIVFISDSVAPSFRGKTYQTLALALFILFFAIPYILKPFSDSLNKFQTSKVSYSTYEYQIAHDPLVDYAKSNFQRGDYAIFWDIPYHYLATDMRSSTRYYSQNFLTNNFGLKNTFVTPNVVETFLGDVKKNPPKIVVFSKDAFDVDSPILSYFKANFRTEPTLSSGSNFVFVTK